MLYLQKQDFRAPILQHRDGQKTTAMRALVDSGGEYDQIDVKLLEKQTYRGYRYQMSAVSWRMENQHHSRLLAKQS